MRATYLRPETGQIEGCFDGLFHEAEKNSKNGNVGMLDSAATADFTTSALAESGSGAIQLPPQVQRVMNRLKDGDRHRVLDSVLMGMSVYKHEHGCLPTADVIEAALSQGFSAGFGFDPQGHVLDSAGKPLLDGLGTSEHSDPISAFPNRIVVAILSALAEAVPFATYLPADIGSNEARLGIVSHQAGSTFGGYTAGDLMDGINIGQPYLGSERRLTLTLAVGRDTAAGQFTTQLTGGDGVQVLRGRTIVFVNGYPVAAEAPNVNSGIANSPISGVANIAGTQYAVSGYIVIASGVVSLNFSPALPVNSVVESEAFIDYEASPGLSPEMISQVQTYTLYASPWRARARQTIDSKTQYQNEISMDLQSETLIAIRNQFANERHYNCLRKAMSIAQNRQFTFDFAYSIQIGHKMRAQIWQDSQAIIGQADQTMANDTMDHGITHMYVGENVAAQFRGLPAEIWEPSGIVARPGIYRLGRLFGIYDVYYTPRVVAEADANAQILAIGRSTQPARCPLVLGDAVPPTYMPLAFNDDFRFGQGFYARNFTSVNPHQPSASGAALINITNLFGS